MYTTEEIFNQLKSNLKQCNAKHSGFYVSGCLVSNLNKIYYGVNVESGIGINAIHAEVSCIANFMTHRNESEYIKAFYLLADNYNHSFEDFIYCCGNCCQLLHDFAEVNFEIYLFKIDGTYKKLYVNELLPFPPMTKTCNN